MYDSIAIMIIHIGDTVSVSLALYIVSISH